MTSNPKWVILITETNKTGQAKVDGSTKRESKTGARPGKERFAKIYRPSAGQ